MGLLVKPSEVKRQTTSMITALQKDADSIDQVLPSIEEFSGNPALGGGAWEGMKAQLSGHCAVIQGLILAMESMMSDSESLAGAVGDEELDEDKLQKEIEKLEKNNASYSTSIASYQQKIRNLSYQSIGMGTLNEGLKNYYSQQISSTKKLIDLNKEAIEKLQKKLETLYEMESATSGLYGEAMSLYDLSQQGMTALGNSWTGSGFSLPKDSMWQKQLENKWSTSETRIIRQLKKEGWDDPAIEKFKEYLNEKTKGLSGEELIQKLNGILEETYLVGSDVYEILFDGSELPDKKKIELVLKQMGGYLDENGDLAFKEPCRFKFDPNMPPGGSFLDKFSKTVQNAFPEGLTVKDEDKKLSSVELKKKYSLETMLHQFRNTLDQNNIAYVQRYKKEHGLSSDEEAIKAILGEDGWMYRDSRFHNRGLVGEDIDFGDLTSKNLLNKDGFNKLLESNGFNRKILSDDYHSEFIIDEKGNLVSQWGNNNNKYDQNKGIVNGESFNYGAKPEENDSHQVLDVDSPAFFDTEVRKELKDDWRYPEKNDYFKQIREQAENGKQFKK
ncbi:DUF3114 domain-containing protein [Enterococcus sp. LJL51]|uniref:DUF3114 domain-containing protein n=1 Tax=Enterococcus sp. LJL51 TaxID=3416656 RepID=UPI003CF8B8B6